MSAEIQENFIPRVLGPMAFRPGFQYIGATKSNLAARNVPFVYSNTDTALIEVTNLLVRVWVADALVTRVAVTSSVANSTFTTDLASWTDADEGAVAASVWAAGGYMSLTGDGTSAAIRTQAAALGGGDSGKVHALKVVVIRGPVSIRVGSAAGLDDYVLETVLQTGTHHLAFTPTASPNIQLLSRGTYPVLVDSCAFAASGAMEIAGIWPTAALPLLRYRQSGDVVFVSCYGYRQQRIVRRGIGSWSVEDYVSPKGPFLNENITGITLTASAVAGAVTVLASKPLFYGAHLGALFSLTSVGQTVTSAISAQNTFTNQILVSSTGAGRAFGITVSGVWLGTVTLQRSVGVPGVWVDLVSYSTNQSTTLNDALDNQIIYYRIGIKTGNYTSGTATVTLTHAQGSITGVCQITTVASATSAAVVVLKAFGDTAATTLWSEGSWSTYRGFPSAVALHDGRLWWVGKNRFWGSVVDDYPNFDEDTVGDSGPISRSIGEGPVDSMSWLISGSHGLVAGGGGAEYLGRAGDFDEPLTPTNFRAKKVSTLGSSAPDAVQLDATILFVDKSKTRVYAMQAKDASQYAAEELTILSPEIGAPAITLLAIQRQPDTRIHCLRSDGTVAILVVSATEEVRAWVTVVTDGTVEDIVVLPGTTEDQVYYQVARTVNAATVRYLEKWALVSETAGGQLNKQADSFTAYTGAATTTVTAAHLANRSVVVWADGADVGTLTLNGSGVATLSVAASNIVAGLAYTGRFKSAKLAKSGQALVEKSRVDHLGLVLMNTHYQGLQYGPDFSTLDNLPLLEDGAPTATGTIWSEYNNVYFEFNGSYDTDSRVCLKATAPRPCTVLAAIITTDT